MRYIITDCEGLLYTADDPREARAKLVGLRSLGVAIESIEIESGTLRESLDPRLFL